MNAHNFIIKYERAGDKDNVCETCEGKSLQDNRPVFDIEAKINVSRWKVINILESKIGFNCYPVTCNTSNASLKHGKICRSRSKVI